MDTNPKSVPPDARMREERRRSADEPIATSDDRSNAPPSKVVDTPAALFAAGQADDFRMRWTNIQAAFVDEPRQAVQQADALVAEVMQTLTAGFATERAALEHQLGKGDSVTTEDLRVTLQKYRSFFDRLLKI